MALVISYFCFSSYSDFDFHLRLVLKVHKRLKNFARMIRMENRNARENGGKGQHHVFLHDLLSIYIKS